MDTLIVADRILTEDRNVGMVSETPGSSVLVRDGRLHSVGDPQANRAIARPNAIEQHYPGCSLLPGLINTHVHLCGDLSPEPFATARYADRDTLYKTMHANAQAALRGGCTTVRDLGDARGLAVALRDEIANGDALGPRVLAAGTPLTIPGGHCWFLGGEVRTSAGTTERIDQLADSGVDLIKVMAGGGQMTPTGPAQWESQFGPRELEHIVERAARRGLQVAAHAHGTDTIADCVRAGVATVEHCSWRVGPGQIELRDRTAITMAEQGVVAGDTTPPQWRELATKIPMPAEFQLGDHLSWMWRHGVPIIIGTDSGLPNAVFDDFTTSLELYIERGFSTEYVLTAVTARAADYLGIGSTTGRVIAGLAADLLVVSGDPRLDIQALRRPRLIMAAGRAMPG